MTRLRQSRQQRIHNAEFAARAKRGPFAPPALNEYGLAWAEGTTARILILRGAGVIRVDDMTITPHTDSRFVVVTRLGGGEYACSDDCCNCEARTECRHLKAVRFSGGTKAVHAAYEWRMKCK
jgi:hypothetical protein